MFSYGIGPSVMFSYISERNIRSMVRGVIIALILISLTLVFALRSLKYGALSLIPNLVPIALAFGIWGMLVGEIGIGLSTVVTMCLGIVVDDTVHFLSKYDHARRQQRMNTHDAVRFAFDHVGNALWVTTAVLVTGFLVLTFSVFALNVQLGALTAMTLSIALALDFLLLPSLLMWLDRQTICSCRTCHVGDNQRVSKL